MPKWTENQELAINESSKNIIVSAGAGSGKTAVLTERVIRKLINGVDINNLLILTFTSAAASEMKERIRSAIIDNNLTDQLLKIDSSFITTFDSFALSVVKKYHYLLNIDQDIKVANDLVLKFKKQELLDNIFDELYENEDELFLKYILDFTIKDDSSLKNIIFEILDITKKLNKLSGTQKAYIVDDNRTLNQYKHTATHELGHALGWKGHSPNSADVMYAYSNGIIFLTNRDKKHISSVNKFV